MKNLWIGTALFWFLLAGVMGLVLRSHNLLNFSFNYSNLLHAHSHLAFLGWVFTAFFGLIIGAFVPGDTDKKRHAVQFVILTIANAGMVISFAAGGYNLYSILFSTLHMATAIWFVTGVWKQLKDTTDKPLDLPGKFLKAGIVFMLVSSLGPLMMPVISSTLGKSGFAYTNAVYFYLHFQINGWLTFTLIALFLKQFGVSKRSGEQAGHLPLLLFLSTLLTVFSSMKSTDKPALILASEVAGACLLLIATIGIIKLIFQNKEKFLATDTSRTTKHLMLFVLSAFIVKNIIQAVSTIPSVADFAVSNRYLIIAFLHLYLLGVVTTGLFVLIHKSEQIRIPSFTMHLFLVSFICSEAFIVMKGIKSTGELTYYIDLALILVSAVMVTSIGSMLIHYIRESRFQLPTQILNKIEYENRNNY